MPENISTFLMFTGNAEQAMTFYLSLFPGSSVQQIEKYRAGEMGAEGSVKTAVFDLAGHRMMCIDSPVKHAFNFTPSVSLFVNCADEAELDRLFGQLSAGGQVLMPLNHYGFSQKFGWTNDQFGVSWQLNLPSAPL